MIASQFAFLTYASSFHSSNSDFTAPMSSVVFPHAFHVVTTICWVRCPTYFVASHALMCDHLITKRVTRSIRFWPTRRPAQQKASREKTEFRVDCINTPFGQRTERRRLGVQVVNAFLLADMTNEMFVVIVMLRDRQPSSTTNYYLSFLLF